MTRKRIRSIGTLLLATVVAVVALAVPASPATAANGSLWGELTIFNCGNYPMFVHVLSTYGPEGTSYSIQTLTVPARTGSGAPAAIAYANTLNRWAQVDVVAAPYGQAQVWLGAVWWNSASVDLNVITYGNLWAGTAGFWTSTGWQASPDC
jgi:hypothetical protein